MLGTSRPTYRKAEWKKRERPETLSLFGVQSASASISDRRARLVTVTGVSRFPSMAGNFSGGLLRPFGGLATVHRLLSFTGLRDLLFVVSLLL